MKRIVYPLTWERLTKKERKCALYLLISGGIDFSTFASEWYYACNDVRSDFVFGNYRNSQDMWVALIGNKAKLSAHGKREIERIRNAEATKKQKAASRTVKK